MPTRREFVLSAVAAAASGLIAGSGKLARGDAVNSQSASAPSLGGSPALAGTIDWHNHWVSPGSLAALHKTGYTPPPDRHPGVPSPAPPGPGSAMLTPVEARIDHLDSVCVERQVISWATTTGWDAVLSADQAKPAWTAFNDDLAELVRSRPTRFSGYATVTTADVDWSAGEVERAYRDLGLIGVVLPVGAFQTLEGARHLAPIFEVTQKHGGVVYLHSGPAHASVPGQTTLDLVDEDAPGIRFNLEWTSTYARGVATLTQTSFLDPYPDVTVQIAMLGGLTPFLFEALTTQRDGTGLRDSLRRVYLDASTSRGPHLLNLAVQAIGADRILFGSDYGAVQSIAPVIDAVRRSGLSDSDQHEVFVDNGRQLFARLTKAA